MTTEATGAADSVLHNITGLIVPVGDSAELARALERLPANLSLCHVIRPGGARTCVGEFVQGRA